MPRIHARSPGRGSLTLTCGIVCFPSPKNRKARQTGITGLLGLPASQRLLGLLSPRSYCCGVAAGAAGVAGAAAGAEVSCWPLPQATSTRAAARALRASFVFIDESPDVDRKAERSETKTNAILSMYTAAFYSV